MNSESSDSAQGEQLSSDKRLSRADFVKRIVKGSVSSGTLLVAASVVVDSFLVPPGVAAASSCTAETYTVSGGGGDAVEALNTDGSTDYYVQCAYGTISGSDFTACSGNADSGLGSCNPES